MNLNINKLSTKFTLFKLCSHLLNYVMEDVMSDQYIFGSQKAKIEKPTFYSTLPFIQIFHFIILSYL